MDLDLKDFNQYIVLETSIHCELFSPTYMMGFTSKSIAMLHPIVIVKQLVLHTQALRKPLTIRKMEDFLLLQFYTNTIILVRVTINVSVSAPIID